MEARRTHSIIALLKTWGYTVNAKPDEYDDKRYFGTAFDDLGITRTAGQWVSFVIDHGRKNEQYVNSTNKKTYPVCFDIS